MEGDDGQSSSSTIFSSSSISVISSSMLRCVVRLATLDLRRCGMCDQVKLDEGVDAVGVLQ